jgi:hypothetical protein
VVETERAVAATSAAVGTQEAGARVVEMEAAMRAVVTAEAMEAETVEVTGVETVEVTGVAMAEETNWKPRWASRP